MQRAARNKDNTRVMWSILVVVVAVLCGLLYKVPLKTLVQKSGGFASKSVCSAVFLSNR